MAGRRLFGRKVEGKKMGSRAFRSLPFFCHSFCCPLSALLVAALACNSLAEVPGEQRRMELLAQMRKLAEQTSVQYASAQRHPQLLDNPVFRYDDQPRRFIDATLWAWTDGGRPVAFQKVEAKYHHTIGEPEWGYCFTVATPELLAVAWQGDRRFRSTEAGIRFLELPAAPAIAEGSGRRRRQLRELARAFDATIIIDPRNNKTEVMRLLPTPLMEYSAREAEPLSGAVFGFATSGTNPDLLLLLEAREADGKLQWQFAPVRMTNGGLIVSYQGVKVREIPWVDLNEPPFATWTFFDTPRTPVAGEAAP